MYFNFKIRLLELHGVSSKQTCLGVGKHLIPENDNFKQGARENWGGVIMKVIIRKLEITLLRWKHINTYSTDKCEDIVTYKVSRKLARFDNHRITQFMAYCGITVYLFRVIVMYWLQFAVC